MLPVRFTRIPSLFTHCSHGLRVPSPRYLSKTPVRPVRRRGPVGRREPPKVPSFPASTSTPLQRQEESNVVENDGITVNVFEQDAPGQTKTRRRVDDPSSEVAAIDQLDKDLDEDMHDIEQQIQLLSDPSKDAESILEKVFTAEQRLKIKEQIAKISKEDFVATPHTIEMEGDLTGGGEIFLAKLNESLGAAVLRPGDEKVRRALWRYYERAKIYMPTLPSRIPANAWEILWQTTSYDSPSNVNRMAHISILTKDMAAAGQKLNPEQRFARIEGLFLEDAHQEALSLWEAGSQTGDAGSPEYLEMGIRMYSQSGKLTRAMELLDVLFKLYKTWDPRIIIPVLTTYISQGSQEDFDKAFALYLRLRQRLGSDATMDDYDRISGAFLSAGQKEYAFAVFRDMMLTGDTELPDQYDDPVRAVTDRMRPFVSVSEDAQEVNKLNLEALTFLPRRYQNKYFYGSWMKKLIGLGQLDDCAKVVQLMYERGVRPDAKHVTGLIGAWLRTGHKPAHERGVKTAWAMIQSRLNFVQERRQRELGHSISAMSVHDNTNGARLPDFDNRPAPRATVETFSVLLQYYLRRGMFEHVRHVRNLLVPAEIAMNSYIMNHLLYAELRNRGHREAWARFEVLSRTVTPDLETYWCLWECMKRHIDPARNKNTLGFPQPRQLFARMHEWYTNIAGQNLRDVKDDVDVDMYNEIILCFCLARDLEGSFVALYGLKQMWGLHPEPETIRILIELIARLSAPLPRHFGRPSHRIARLITASREKKENTEHAVQVLDMITQQRRQEMMDQGVDFEQLEPGEQGDEVHRATLQFLYSVMMQVRGEEFDGNAALARAAKEMGIAAFDVDEAMALLV